MVIDAPKEDGGCGLIRDDGPQDLPAADLPAGALAPLRKSSKPPIRESVAESRICFFLNSIQRGIAQRAIRTVEER
jgi:hypothetical protein